MKILLLFFSITGGYMPMNDFYLYESMEILRYENQIGYLQFDAEFVLYDLFYFGGNVRLNTIFKQIDSFSPIEAYYSFRLGIRPTDNIEIGLLRNCYHPLLAYLPIRQLKTDYDFNIEGAYLEIYIKVKGEIVLIE